MVLLFSQTWFIDGLVVPCRVTGGSMALSLLGMHRDVVCADCGFTFSCDADTRPVSPRAVCPNCGYANNSMELLPDLAGDRVLIDHSSFHFRRPRRWEIVAFRHPREAETIVIKRVVGLPGESVQIKNGDVYINGQIQRKTLDQQRSMAVMVHDAKYATTTLKKGTGTSLRSEPVPFFNRWRGENEKTLWHSDGGQFMHPNTSESLVKGPHPSPLPKGEGTIDWLVYHHGRRLPDINGGVEECPISDIMPYNQTLPRRQEEVHALNDVMLCFRLVKTIGRGNFFIRAIAGGDVFRIEIDPNAGIYRVTRNDREITQTDNRPGTKFDGLDVVVSLMDQQFLLAFGDRTVLCLPIGNNAAVHSESTSQPFALGTQGLGVVVENVRIYRDIYYTPTVAGHGLPDLDKKTQLGGDEYFVLGDNSSISEDSRTWSHDYPVVDNMLIGKPLVILFPAKSITIGDWQFPVPDINRIGYIR